MTPEAMISTSVDDLKSSLKCSELGGAPYEVDSLAAALKLIESSPIRHKLATKRKLLEATLARWTKLQDEADDNENCALTSREAFKALGFEEQFKMLADVELMRATWYRLRKQDRRQFEEQIASLKMTIVRMEREGEQDLARSNNQSQEIWTLANDLKVLRRQLEEAGITPLR